MIELAWFEETSFPSEPDLMLRFQEGVYILQEAKPLLGRCVYVGQGQIGQRIAAHTRDQKIMNYWPLTVYCAPVDAPLRNGVERYLADHYQPLVGTLHPNSEPIRVNLPFLG